VQLNPADEEALALLNVLTEIIEATLSAVATRARFWLSSLSWCRRVHFCLLATPFSVARNISAAEV
jgi:hypothetical protein